MEEDINFFAHDVDFSPDDPAGLQSWIREVVVSGGKTVNTLNFIFCSDEYVLGLNRKHLDHDYLTDILTFPLSESPEEALLADIYISTPRVEENAKAFEIPFKDELHRVMIHGVLHLMGHSDHTDPEKKQMREQEDRALSLRTF